MTLPPARLSLALAGTLALSSSSGLERMLRASARASADSIYGLAVDSAKYREYPYVSLLDDGVVRLEKDGKSSRTYRQVVQILKPDGVAPWAEKRFTDRKSVV